MPASLPPLDVDRAATTPLLAAAVSAMAPWWGAQGANASAVHAGGRRARAALEGAREQVAGALGVASAEVIFTSGATEALALALLGFSERHPGGRVLLSRLEHPALVRVAELLERRGGAVSWLEVGPDGVVHPEALQRAWREDIRLVAVMRTNNETGAENDVATIADLVHERGALLLCDAVQAFGFEAELGRLGADMMALSAHKVGGPQGIGALVVRGGLELQPQALGGLQERGRRAGTSALALAVGFGAAAAVAAQDPLLRRAQVAAVRDRFEAELLANGGVERSLPAGTMRGPKHAHLVVEALKGEAETLLMALDLEGVWASLGSACAAGSLEPSPVLVAMGWSTQRARSAVRFSFGPDHSDEDAREGARRVRRALAPWLG
jgi:cysteine desulfurase